MLYQGMVCLAGNQVWWTWEVEDVFRKVKAGLKTAMKEYAKKQHQQIDDLVKQIRSPLSKNDRSKFNTVLILDVHARDIIDGFVRDRYLDPFIHRDLSDKMLSELLILFKITLELIINSQNIWRRVVGWISINISPNVFWKLLLFLLGKYHQST